MLERGVFLRPTAHRGLFNPASGVIENTAPAFEAAIAKGYGIECDLRPAAGGLPIVFHDVSLDRLVDGSGPVGQVTAPDLKRLRYKSGRDTAILTLSELFDLVAGRVPLLLEVKSEWDPPDRDFLSSIAKLTGDYKGPAALMSFDPAVMRELRELAPGIPRGIVSGGYRDEGGAPWWPGKIGRMRAFRLANLLETSGIGASFIAYDVRGLPRFATGLARRVCGLPLFTWTVRTEADRRVATQYADAPIFEGYEA